VIAAELVSGHTRTVEPAAVMWTAAAIHLAGSAFWVGGLAVVAAVLAGGIRRHDRARGRTDAGARSAGEVIARFSRLAAWAVAVLAAAGAALGWATVRGPAAVTTTTYGTALLVKLVMVAAALGLALRNRRRLLPNLLADGETAALRRGLAWEVVALAAVVGATAVLVNLPPAAEANAGPISQTVAFGDDLQLNVVVDPGRPGTNEVHLYVLTPGGLPALVEGEAALELRLPAEDLGPIERTPLVAGPGHFLHAGPELALGGEWVLRVRLRESEFEERTGEVTVRIP
jgi:copper transport protein